MKRALTIYCLILALIGGWILSAALTCYKIGWDLQWHTAWCWSNEFVVDDEGQPTATDIEINYPTDAPTATDELPLPWPTATQIPYPWPTWEPNPYP